MIPPTIVRLGDVSKANEFIKPALAQLAILKNLMSFQKMNEGNRKVQPFNGVLLECVSSFNTDTIYITVDPFAYDPPKRVSQIENVEDVPKTEDVFTETNPIDFFVRIAFPLVTDQESLNMDRIIIWQMAYDATINDPTSYNAGGYIPGTGSVLYDVDIVNNIVYFPTGIVQGSIEALEIIDIVNAYEDKIQVAKIDSNSPMYDAARDWFDSGGLEDPMYSSVAGGYTLVDEEEYEFNLSDGYETAEGEVWWLFTDPVPRYMDYFYSALFVQQWREKWSPLEGGDNDQYKDNYAWVGIPEVEEFYPNLTMGGMTPEWVVLGYTGSVGCDETNWSKDCVGILTGNKKLVSTTFRPTGGVFFTPPAEDIEHLEDTEGINSMFVVQVAEDASLVTSVYSDVLSSSYQTTYPVGTPAIDVTSGGWGQPLAYITGGKTGRVKTHIMTPLEVVEEDDYLSTNHGDVTCSEFSGLYWDTFDLGSGNYEKGFNSNSSTDLVGWDDAVEETKAFFGHTDLGTGEDGIYYKEVAEAKYDSGSSCAIHAVNRLSTINAEGATVYNKYFSLFYMDEVKGAVSAARTDYSGDYPTCNGVTYADVLSAPKKKRCSVGCIIYIFAPDKFTWVDDLGVNQYWDIHGARVGQSIINPYRCLDLEEYMLEVFTGIQEAIDSDTEIPLLDDNVPIGYSMSAYGFEITNGFVESDRVESTLTEVDEETGDPV